MDSGGISCQFLAQFPGRRFGISAENLAEVAEAGATRVAVGAAICAANDPEATARQLFRELTRDPD